MFNCSHFNNQSDLPCSSTFGGKFYITPTWHRRVLCCHISKRYQKRLNNRQQHRKMSWRQKTTRRHRQRDRQAPKRVSIFTRRNEIRSRSKSTKTGDLNAKNFVSSFHNTLLQWQLHISMHNTRNNGNIVICPHSSFQLTWTSDGCKGGTGPKFSYFHAVFAKIWQICMLAPLGGLAPPPTGILDPPLCTSKIFVKAWLIWSNASTLFARSI